MIKDEHRLIIDKGGFIYWKKFFQDRRGNPWSVRPSLMMLEDYLILYMSKKNALTHAIETGEVFFDASYVAEWKEHHLEGLDFLFPDVVESKSIIEILNDFEAKNGIIISKVNPRHSLYCKFKESIQNDHRNSN